MLKSPYAATCPLACEACPYITSSANSTHLYSRIGAFFSTRRYKRHADLPWPREHFRIFDGGFVHQCIGAARRIALHDVQRVAVDNCRLGRTMSVRSNL